MGYRPIISKIRVFNPNKNGARRSNYNYLHYIATREGTDLTDIKMVSEEQLINMNIDLNEKGEDLLLEGSPDESYLKYIAHRPKSHGLFGNIETDEFGDVSKKLNEASVSGKVVYRGILSLSEVDAKALGFLDKRKWDMYLREVLPDIAKELGISQSNHTWVAAYHAEPTHPHVHFILWDNRDIVKSPYIHPATQNKCRLICEKAMFTEENEKIIRTITQGERKEFYSLKNASRDHITAYFKDIFKNRNLVPVPGEESDILSGRMVPEKHKELIRKYKEIIHALPGNGRMAYKFMPPECKQKIDEATELFLSQSDVAKEYAAYLKAEENIQRISGKTEIEISWKLDEARKDLYTRAGNVILKGISQMQEEILENDNSENSIIYDESMEVDEIPEEVEQAGFLKEDIQQARNEGNYHFDWDTKKNAMNLYYNKENSEEKRNELRQEGIQLLEREAEKGNILCIEQLAQIYQYQSKKCEIPGEKEKLEAISLKWHEKSVSALDEIIQSLSGSRLNKKEEYILSYANYRIGFHCLKGLGIEKDIERAEKYLKKSDLKYSHYWLGNIYEKEKEGKLQEAIDQYKIAANKRHGYASFSLGKIYRNKESDLYNIEAAVNYYEQAGILIADVAAAKIYGDKSCPVYDPVKAMEKYEDVLSSIQTADQEFNDKITENMAKLGLAKLYMDRESKNFDYRKAMELLEGATDERGTASYYRGKIYSDSNSVYYNMGKAIECFTMSANDGNSMAMYKLGRIYQYGIGVERDRDTAKFWMEKAAALGNEVAREALRNMDNIDLSKYTYAILRQIISNTHKASNRNKQRLQEWEFATKGKQQQREDYLHHN